MKTGLEVIRHSHIFIFIFIQTINQSIMISRIVVLALIPLASATLTTWQEPYTHSPSCAGTQCTINDSSSSCSTIMYQYVSSQNSEYANVALNTNVQLIDMTFTDRTVQSMDLVVKESNGLSWVVTMDAYDASGSLLRTASANGVGCVTHTINNIPAGCTRIKVLIRVSNQYSNYYYNSGDLYYHISSMSYQSSSQNLPGYGNWGAWSSYVPQIY
jgi:hypothetical protein